MNHWPTLAALPLVVESLEYAQLDPGPGYADDAHSTRLVRLRGDGHEGLSEDITLFAGGAAPNPQVDGTWTLGEFCAHLLTIEQWPEPLTGEFADNEDFVAMAHRWRNWAFESAALDLALAQADRSLHDVLGIEPAATRYVNSFGMGDTDVVANARRRLALYPDLRFKLDVAEYWDDDVVASLAATGAVDVVDFKGRYGMPIEHPEALPALYERVIAAFPDALIEDPHDRPEITEIVAPHAARVSYDAPIHEVADLGSQPIQARTFNIKPSRIGRLEDLFALYATCEERGFAIYGGGMGELGVARGQIQLLASLFSPDATNDIAPPGFNALVPEAGLPLSPVDPDPADIGFRRRVDA